MEELDELREELVSARAEAERLAEQVADREARAAQLAEGMETLRRQVEAARMDAAQARAAATEEAQRLADRYRAALLQAAPDVPPELVQGASVEELDRSLATAREVVARVREQMQAQAASRIPTGSPVRGGTDLGTLSPAEQIRAGIEQVRR